jgi:tRNA dimethylallyltransferase
MSVTSISVTVGEFSSAECYHGCNEGGTMAMVRAVLIAGPTASGKSALALDLAEKLDGVIINADSMQVYRELHIITARPPPEEETRAPHRLYGFVDAAENYSVGHWCRDVGGVLKETAAQGRVPVLVGGTGLYFKALTIGLAAVPPIPADIRAEVRTRLQREGAPALHAELMQLDPATAQRVTINDRSRISRALEVVLATGRPLSDWHIEGLPPIIDPKDALKIFITCERSELVRRIEMRFATMLKSGALEEVRRLAGRKLDPTLPAMKAHGVPWLIRYLNGEISLDQAQAGAVMDTRRYAKRQLTWFRNQMKDWRWVSAEEANAELLDLICHVVARTKTS